MKIDMFNDVVDSGMIQKRKEKYTLTDAKRLSKKYNLAIDSAKWILLCSAAFWREEQRRNGEEITITCTRSVFRY